MTTPTEQIRTYRELFANDDLDPLRGDFTAAAHLYRVDHNPYEDSYLHERAGPVTPHILLPTFFYEARMVDM